MKKEKEPKEKKVKEKKPKKPKEPRKNRKKGKGAPEETPENEPQQQGGKKKKKSKVKLLIPLILVLAAAAAAVYFFVLKNKDGADDPNAEPSEQVVEPQPPELPEELKVGEVSVAGMALGADESEAKAELAKTITYTYTNLNNAGAAAATYVKQLATAEEPFFVVDEEFVKTSQPDYNTEEGMVLMARNLVVETKEEDADKDADQEDGKSEGEGEDTTPAPTPTPAPAKPDPKVLTVRISWSKAQCVVTADEAIGMVTSPPPKQHNSGASMGIMQAKDYLSSLPPADLGLEGTSMDQYEVTPIEGVVMVDDVACTRINVYNDNNPGQSNEFMGSYLVSIDGSHIYRLDPRTNQIEMVK